MQSYNKLNTKHFKPSPSFYDDVEVWLEAERLALTIGAPMPSPRQALEAFPVIETRPESVTMRLKSTDHVVGSSPREFDSSLAILAAFSITVLDAQLAFNPVRKDHAGGGQTYLKFSFKGVEGGSFSYLRLAKDTPVDKHTKFIGDYHDCRASNLRFADPEGHHKDPTLNGKGRFITMVLARYDLGLSEGEQLPIPRDRFERIVRGLLEVHTLREQKRQLLQAA